MTLLFLCCYGILETLTVCLGGYVAGRSGLRLVLEVQRYIEGGLCLGLLTRLAVRVLVA